MPWLGAAGAAGGAAGAGVGAAGAAGAGIGAGAGAGLGAAGTAAMSTVPTAALTGTTLGAAAPGLGVAGTAPLAGTAGGLGLGGAAATPALSMGAAAPAGLWSQITGGAGKLGENLVQNLKQQASDRFQSATGGMTADPKGAQPKRIGTAKQKLPKLEAADTSGTPAPGPRRGLQQSGSSNERMAMILQSIFAPRGY